MKILMNESQLRKLTSTLVESEDTNQYQTEVEVKFDYYGATFNGEEIEDIAPINIPVTFAIDIEQRSWGVKGIQLHNIKGPESVESQVITYGHDDEQNEDTVTISLDWDSCETENDGQGIITVTGVRVDLTNDESGNLVCKELIAEVSTL
jgi:hypothetical protein